MKTITVSGTGEVFVKPDHIELSMSLEARNPEYGAVMEEMNEKLAALQKACVQCRFKKDDLKTESLQIHTEYEGVRDEHGDYRQEFKGYAGNQSLSLEMPLSMSRLAKVLSAIAGTGAKPVLSLRFTAKDTGSARESLLKQMADNARAKAEGLAEAAGVKVGGLISIDTQWQNYHLVSDTSYDMVEENAVARPMLAMGKIAQATPKDIRVTDTARFVWELLS